MQSIQEQNAPAKAIGIAHSERKQPTEEVIASSGITFQLWRLYQHAWLVCLFFPLVSLACVSERLRWMGVWKLVRSHSSAKRIFASL